MTDYWWSGNADDDDVSVGARQVPMPPLLDIVYFDNCTRETAERIEFLTFSAIRDLDITWLRTDDDAQRIVEEVQLALQNYFIDTAVPVDRRPAWNVVVAPPIGLALTVVTNAIVSMICRGRYRIVVWLS